MANQGNNYKAFVTWLECRLTGEIPTGQRAKCLAVCEYICKPLYSVCRMHNADGEATPTGTRALLDLLSHHGFSQHAVPQPSDQSDSQSRNR